MGDTVQKIVEAGTARANEKLKPDSSTRSNPEAMADKVVKEGAKAVRSQAAKGQADAETANLAQVSMPSLREQRVESSSCTAATSSDRMAVHQCSDWKCH